MSFSSIIRGYRRDNNLTQDELVRTFSQYEELKNIDCVTLSRWENGKTQPATKKMFLILSIINSFDLYLKQLITAEIKNEDKKVIKKNIVDDFLSEIYPDNVNFHSLLLFGDLSFSYENLDFKLLTFDDLPEVAKKMVLSENKYTDELYSKDDDFYCFFYKNEFAGLSLHVMKDSSKLKFNKEKKGNLTNSSEIDSIIMIKNYAMLREVWEVSFLMFLLNIIKNLYHIDNVYFVFLGDINVEPIYKIGAEHVYSYGGESQIDTLNLKYNILRMDVLDGLSFKGILTFIVSSYVRIMKESPRLIEKLDALFRDEL